MLLSYKIPYNTSGFSVLEIVSNTGGVIVSLITSYKDTIRFVFNPLTKMCYVMDRGEARHEINMMHMITTLPSRCSDPIPITNEDPERIFYKLPKNELFDILFFIWEPTVVLKAIIWKMDSSS